MDHPIISLEKITVYIKKEYLYIGALLGFIIIATIISSNFSKDSYSYNQVIDSWFGVTGWSALTAEMLHREMFFLVISKILYQIGLSSVFLFLIYSVISLPVKFYLIDRYSKDKWLSLAFFSSYFFILLDSTQIRFGIAVACLYLGLCFLAKDKKWQFSVMVVLSAVMFHFSSLVFIVMLFFTNKRSIFWLMGMIAIAVLLYPLNLHVILLDVVSNAIDYFNVKGSYLNKLYRYLSNQDPDVFLGMFRIVPLLVCICLLILYRYKDKFSAYEMLCYNSLLLSIFFYILLKDILILQVRFSDMFGFSLVFLVPYVHRGISEYIGAKYAYIILYSFFSIHLVKFTLYDKMLIL